MDVRLDAATRCSVLPGRIDFLSFFSFFSRGMSTSHQSLITAILQIESIDVIITQATSVLRQAHNERSSLLKLPVEILQKILELVPDPYANRWTAFRPFWRHSLLDSSMLISVTHTCRRLREVSLAHPHLYTTFRISFEMLPLIRQMATRSERIPLNVIGSDISMLEELPSNTRFRSIHLYDIEGIDSDLLPTVINQCASPALHSFSLFCGERHLWDPDKPRLSPSPEQAPNLRYLTLDRVEAVLDKGFPFLTHLALMDLPSYTEDSTSSYAFHARLVGFIRECPRLECVALISLDLAGRIGNVPPPIPLHHLKHVALFNLSPHALNYYTALLQPCVNGSSIQIVGCDSAEPSFPRRFLLPLPPNSADEPETETPNHICIGVHPITITSPIYVTSLTFISSRSTRHFAIWNGQLTRHGITPYEWPSRVLSQCVASRSGSPLPVEEVSLYGFSTTAFPRMSSPLMHFPHAPRVVVAIDRRQHYDDVPTLRLLPSAHDGLPGPIAIATLRLVHGFSAPPDSDGLPSSGYDPDPVVTYHLPLGQLVKDFRSGGYGYLRHLVLQVTPNK